MLSGFLTNDIRIVSNTPRKAKYNSVNEKHVVSVVLEFEIIWCKIQQNLLKNSVKVSKLFVLLVQYPLVKGPNLHNLSKLVQYERLSNKQ